MSEEGFRKAAEKKYPGDKEKQDRYIFGGMRDKGWIPDRSLNKGKQTWIISSRIPGGKTHKYRHSGGSREEAIKAWRKTEEGRNEVMTNIEQE